MGVGGLGSKNVDFFIHKIPVHEKFEYKPSTASIIVTLVIVDYI